jgi:Peptidase family M1 domain
VAGQKRRLGTVRCILALIIWSTLCHGADGQAAATGRAIQQISLDPEQCYRVRDFVFQKEDLKIYLTEGRLLLTRPVEGRRLAAVFVADVPGGDAELMVFPPHSSERLSLASFAKTPNLNEHFTSAIFVFTDDTGAELLELLKDSKKEPEAGLLLSERFESVVRNIAASYEIRLVYDLLASDWKQNGMFFGAVSGKTLANFDVLYDPRGREQIVVGQLAYRDNRPYFDTWTSFRSRAVRNGFRKTFQYPLAVRNIVIDATLHPDLSLTAKTKIELTATDRSDLAVPFELSRRMKVTDVRVDGEPVEYFVRESLRANLVRGSDNDTFLVVLPKPVEPGESRVIEIAHEGQVISSSGNGVYYVEARSNWYPSYNKSFATYDLTFRYPENLQLVSTGDVLEDKKENPWRITRRRVSSPIRFAGFNLGDYDKASATRAGFTIEVYANRRAETALVPRPRDFVTPLPPQLTARGSRRTPEMPALPLTPLPPDPRARLRSLAGEIGDAMEFMSATFGPPPLKTLTVSPIPGTFGQGFPGLLYLSTLAYLNPDELPAPLRTDSQRRFFSELLHAHELAHQWWGNLVTSDSYQDDWLMEALANYSALLVLEKKKGRRALEMVLDEYRQHLLADSGQGKTIESAGPIVWGTRLISSQTASSWRVVMYEKGAWIIHMLRVRMGDAAFHKMLNALAQRHRYERISTEQFRVLAAEFQPKGIDDPELEDFFEQWVYGTGIPSLKVRHSVRGKTPKLRVQGSILQSDVNEDFSVLVPVEIQLANKQTTIKWIRTSSETAEFAADLRQAPIKIQIDPYAVLMRR